jgi:hypothetical protein
VYLRRREDASLKRKNRLRRTEDDLPTHFHGRGRRQKEKGENGGEMRRRKR